MENFEFLQMSHCWSEYRFEREKTECIYSSITYYTIVISEEKNNIWFPLSKDTVLSLLGIGQGLCKRSWKHEKFTDKLMSRQADRLFSDKLSFAYSSGKLKLKHKTKNKFV